MPSNLPSKPQTTGIVPITREDNLPPLVDLEVDRELPKLVSWRGSGGKVELRRPFTAAEKACLQRRASTLRSALAAWPESSRAVIEGELALMLNVPANRGLDELVAAGMVAQYLMLARHHPHWAVVKVCRNIRAGKAGLNPAFCPTEAEFNLLLDREVDFYRRRLANVEQLQHASAPRADPAECAEMQILGSVSR